MAQVLACADFAVIPYVHDPFVITPTRRAMALCADKGVAVIVNRAFEDGNLFSAVQGKPLPAWAADFGAKSWAQVFLKFVLAHPAVTCVIPATGKVRNLVDNIGAAIGKLPDGKQRAQIVSALA